MPLRPTKITCVKLAALFSYFLYLRQTAYTIGNTKYFLSFDDVMISMRYGKNLARGFGLTWNPGEPRVEGFSNFLWTIYCAFIHLVGFPDNIAPLVLNLTSAAFLFTNISLAVSIAKLLRPNDEFAQLVAAILVAFCGALNCWGLAGFEFSAISTIYLLATKVLFTENYTPAKKSLNLGLLSSLAFLIRMDSAATFAFVFLALLTQHQIGRARNTIRVLFPFLITALTLTFFRYLYYGELFPNTYYLKMSNYDSFLKFWIGLKWSGLTCLFTLPAVILTALIGIIASAERNKLASLFFIFTSQIVYTVLVGGDSWEHMGAINRYISSVLPLCLIVSSIGVSVARDQFYSPVTKQFMPICLTVLIFCSINIQFLGFIDADASKFGAFKHLQRAIYIKEKMASTQSMALHWAGIIPYFTDKKAIDLLGKSDKAIARQRANTRTGYNPGHSKWDYRHSILTENPDILADYDLSSSQFFDAEERKTVSEFFTVNDNGVYVRKKSAL